MNRANIDTAIAIMRRAEQRDSVWMILFQTGLDVRKTEAELHACGNKACFAGHIGISPEWIAAGGTVNWIGEPVLNGNTAYKAIAEWLDIPRRTAHSIIFGDLQDEGTYSAYYQLPWHDVRAPDVIAKLMELKNAS